MANSAAQQQMVMKQDLLRPKLDDSDPLKRIEDLERRIEQLERRG
jgi:hypothetical protein